MNFWTEFRMLDETQYPHSHAFIQLVSSNILKFKSLKVHSFNNSKFEKERREGILQQKYKGVKDRRSDWI